VADQLIPDGTTDFSGGQNAAVEPDAIGPNQYYIGVNVSAQKTCLTPRWGLTELELDWSAAGNYVRTTGLEVSFEKVFLEGKFQAFVPYKIGPDSYNIYIVSGYIFLINLSSLVVQVLNPLDCLNVHADRINWSAAGQYIVIFDFPNVPFILDGVQLRRSDTAADEVPISNMGTYNQNRLCIANAGIDWTAGDPAGSLSTPNAPITFIEIMQASSPYVGDVYQLPTAHENSETITAMGFLQVLDKSTEIGPCLIATNEAIYSYRTDLPRSQWQGGVNSIVFGSVLLYSEGIVSQRAHENVGGDIIFLSSDAQVRSMTMARDAQYRWSNSPISREVNNFLQTAEPDLYKYAVVYYFNNKIFVTCNPYRVNCASAEGNLQTDYVHSGVVVLELDHLGGIGEKSNPSWAGAWTGTQFLDFAANDKKLYVAGKQDGKNKMYIFDPSRTYDTIGGKIRNVRSVLFTKEYTNTDQTVNKAIHSVDFGFRQIKEKVTVNVTYKPSTSETFNFWRDLTFNAPVEQCSAYPDFPQGLQPQGIRDLNIGGVKENVCNESTDDFMHVYKGVQLRLIIEGRYWELAYIKLKGLALSQSELDAYCTEYPGKPIPAECFDMWKIPSMEDC